MNKLNEILSLLTTGLFFRVHDSNSNKVIPWSNLNAVPNFKERIIELLDFNENLRVSVGKPSGNRFKVVKEFLVENTESKHPVLNPILPGVSIPKPTLGSEHFQQPAFIQPNSFPNVYEEHYKIAKERNGELKEELNEVKKDLKEVRRERDEYKLKFETQEKKYEYDLNKSLYDRDNTLAGVLRQAGKPETLDSLGSVVSAIKGEKEESTPQLGNTEPFDSDVKNAIIQIIGPWTDEQAGFLISAIKEESFMEQMNKHIQEAK